jgi:hypothetical protein
MKKRQQKTEAEKEREWRKKASLSGIEVRVEQIQELHKELFDSIKKHGLNGLDKYENKLPLVLVDDPSLSYVKSLQDLIVDIKGYCKFSNYLKKEQAKYDNVEPSKEKVA